MSLPLCNGEKEPGDVRRKGSISRIVRYIRDDKESGYVSRKESPEA